MTSIEAEGPVTVAQYMKSYDTDYEGDAAMMIVPPIESFVNNVTFPVIRLTYTYIFQYNIHVTINCVYANDLVFDDTQSMSDWQRLETDDGEMCAIRGNVTTGVHSVTHHDPEAKFTVAVYGIEFGTAYAYPAGYATDEGKNKLYYIAINQEVSLS